jgi:hypothetical protein
MNVEEELFGIKKRTQAINSKRKGNVNEARLTKILFDWTGHEFARVPRSGGLRWKNRMDICGDVINTDSDFDFPFSIETKHVASLGLKLDQPVLRSNSVVFTYWTQCNRDAEATKKIPIMMLKYNGMPSDMYYVFIQLTKDQLYEMNKILHPMWVQARECGKIRLYGYPSTVLFKFFTYEQFKKIMK